MEWADPAEAATAPPHGLRPWQTGNRIGNDLAQYVRRRPALPGNDCDVIIALFVAALLALLQRNARRFQKSLNRLFRCASPRAFAFLGAVFLGGGQSADRNRQPPWPRKTADGFKQQSMIRQS